MAHYIIEAVQLYHIIFSDFFVLMIEYMLYDAVFLAIWYKYGKTNKWWKATSKCKKGDHVNDSQNAQ